MSETKYSKERLIKSGALGVSADVAAAALPEGGSLTLEEARRIVQKFLKRKVCD